MKQDEASSNQCSSNDLLSQIIKARGYDSQSLVTDLNLLPDETLFANIENVEKRIRTALYNNEPLVIFGHDDPDGITSTFILSNFLTSCGYQKHCYYIPNRNLFPHGIQSDFINFVREKGIPLIITVDNGIAAYEGVNQLNAMGCEVIITDHHIVQPDILPPAYTIMNPQLPECQYPFKQLAGAGVVLMLIRYLSRLWNHPVEPVNYFWTAVGSLADKVPMIGLNRIIVRYVLEHFAEMQEETVNFLLRNYNHLSTPTEIFNFLHNTAHLIANGREASGQHTAMRFLLQSGEAKAQLFEELEHQKNEWESELNRIFKFMDTLASDFVGNWFVYYDDEDVIPYALLGTAATYIVNKLHIPTLILKNHNGNTVCEGRCSENFNIMSAFTHCKKHLKQFGGHRQAAGFTMSYNHYDAFLECFNNYLQKNYSPDNSAKINYDAEALVTDLNSDNWRKLEVLLPWGQQNPEPAILIRNTSKAELNSCISLDNNGKELPPKEKGDAVVLWKTPNLVKVLSWQPHFKE